MGGFRALDLVDVLGLVELLSTSTDHVLDFRSVSWGPGRESHGRIQAQLGSDKSFSESVTHTRFQRRSVRRANRAGLRHAGSLHAEA